MNPESTPNSSPAPAEATAAAYIAGELPKARRALRRTQITGVIFLCLMGTYMLVVSYTLASHFRPRPAAEVASGMLVRHIEGQGPVLAKQIEQEIPLLIRRAPDYVIGQLPSYRLQAEQMVEVEFQAYCTALSKDLGQQMDRLIEDQRAEIKSLLENAKDRERLRKILPDLENVITRFLQTDTEGRAMNQHVTELAAALSEIEKRMDRLANGQNLTAEEQKARRTLAILAKVIRDNTREPVTTKSEVKRTAMK